jgi:glycine cleavage system H protein
MANQFFPGHLNYSKEHEWAKIEGNIATIGITNFAQNSLGDIVFVELPDVGRKLAAEDSFGVVESIKSVSDLYSPFSGEILEVNSELVNSPEKINSNAYDAWMIKIKMSNPNEVNNLMSAEDYKNYCEKL